MAPIRGLKRKRKSEKKVDQNVLVASLGSQLNPLDWWDDFSQRITGQIVLFSFFVLCIFFHIFCFLTNMVCSFILITYIGFGYGMVMSGFAVHKGIGWDCFVSGEILGPGSM